ncbi:MAG: hypothetical protein IKD47_00300 [Clostridia bacterium]|nr:hypothetical protein [Clostridia bacterium]
MPISKTDFVRALQCQKMLWLDSHHPEEKIIPPEVQARLDAGNDFGDGAMGIFGEYVETTTYREDGRLHFAAMLEKTKQLLEENTPVVCEAAFSWYGNYCAADILKKDGNSYALYEVKNSAAVRKEFLVDLGFQRLILRKNGVPLSSSHLVLPALNEPLKIDEEGGHVRVETVFHGDIAYKIVDVTAAAKRMERLAEKHIFEFGKLKRKDAPCPLIGVGEHCDTPYRCWYYEYCHGIVSLDGIDGCNTADIHDAVNKETNDGQETP